jgi:hypothetical protein
VNPFEDSRHQGHLVTGSWQLADGAERFPPTFDLDRPDEVDTIIRLAPRDCVKIDPADFDPK